MLCRENYGFLRRKKFLSEARPGQFASSSASHQEKSWRVSDFLCGASAAEGHDDISAMFVIDPYYRR